MQQPIYFVMFPYIFNHILFHCRITLSIQVILSIWLLFKVDNILMINDDNDMGGAQRWENHIGREDIISEQPLST